MAKRRLGVALLIPEPFAAEINGLRRGLNDGGLNRIVPHLTLVPPVNVREDELPAALSVLRTAAAVSAPFDVALGPVTSFAPVTPTVMLGVSGAGVGQVASLRNAIFKPPFERELTYPFVPHVTLADDADDERIAHAVSALADYAVTVRFERVHLLQEVDQRKWVSIADAAFRPSTAIGRGGLMLELSVTQLVDPEVAQALNLSPVVASDLVITARHAGEVIGVVVARISGQDVNVSHVVVDERHRRIGVASHLMRALFSEGASRVGGLIALECDDESALPFFEKLGFVGGVRPL